MTEKGLREHYDVITGRSKYIDDLELPGTVHLGVVRSQYAKARITSMAEPSRALLFLTWKDVGIYMPVRPDPRSKNVV
jgi:Aerobic-type carbon monoxide dehydrogenase, large subunit CoxL/CutL homologs